MRIVVTGAGGQVGSELQQHHALAGAAVPISLTRSDLDISDAAAVDRAIAFHAPDLVVNAAGYTAVDRAETEPECAFAANRDGPAHLARTCGHHGIPLFHLSTDYIFSGTGRTPWREDDEPCPQSVYGASKWAGEQAIRESQEQHVILRTSWVFSTTGSNFVKTILRLAREQETLRIVADQTGCPTWAGHIADIIMTLATELETEGRVPWGTYHYCGTPPTTWHGFAEEILQQAHEIETLRAHSVTPITTADYATAAPRPAFSVLSCDQLEAQFGVEPPSWKAALRGVLQELCHA